MRSARRQTGNFYRTDTFTRLRPACKMPAQKSSNFSVNFKFVWCRSSGPCCYGRLALPRQRGGRNDYRKANTAWPFRRFLPSCFTIWMIPHFTHKSNRFTGKKLDKIGDEFRYKNSKIVQNRQLLYTIRIFRVKLPRFLKFYAAKADALRALKA